MCGVQVRLLGESAQNATPIALAGPMSSNATPVGFGAHRPAKCDRGLFGSPALSPGHRPGPGPSPSPSPGPSADPSPGLSPGPSPCASPGPGLGPSLGLMPSLWGKPTLCFWRWLCFALALGFGFFPQPQLFDDMNCNTIQCTREFYKKFTENLMRV